MRYSMIVIAAAALGVAAPAMAQVSTGGVAINPIGGPGDSVQHTNAARVDLGGGQAARVIVIPGRDTPAEGGVDTRVLPGAQSSNVPTGSASAGAAALDGGELKPQGFAAGSAGHTSVGRAVVVYPGDVTSNAPSSSASGGASTDGGAVTPHAGLASSGAEASFNRSVSLNPSRR